MSLLQIVFQVLLTFVIVSQSHARIVGGIEVVEGEYPSYVHAIDGYLCGGTLIHSDIVLTAAHCDNAFLAGKTVYIGAIDIGGVGDETNVVQELYPHPNYNENDDYENDIMLFKLTSKSSSPTVTLNQEPTIPMVESKVDVIGFGLTQDPDVYPDADISDKLMEVRLTVQEFWICSALYDNPNETTQICAGELAGGKDSCYGDSGGPLFVAGTNIQVGIVSYGDGCALGDLSGIYTRVSAFIDFIEEGICQLSDDPPERCFPNPPPPPPPQPPKEKEKSHKCLFCCDRKV